jgi:guanine nucleotide-binding protein G(i) subunit alpha
MIQCCKFLFYMKLLQNEPHQEPTEKDYDNAAATIRSKAIDRALQEDATTLRRETKIMLMGQNNSGKELIMHQVKVLYADGYYSSEDRLRYLGTVRSTVRLLIHAMIDLLKDTGINLPKDLNQDFAVLLDEVESVDIQ